jgi:hypothetical protein
VVPSAIAGLAAVTVATFAIDIDLRPPPLPGVPHVPVARPAEAIPAPVTLEFAPPPELRPLAPPVPAFEPQALVPSPQSAVPPAAP